MSHGKKKINIDPKVVVVKTDFTLAKPWLDYSTLMPSASAEKTMMKAQRSQRT